VKTNAVKITLWGITAGYLSWDEKAGVALFEYEPDFLTKGLDIAPLTMPLNALRTQKQMPWQGNKDRLYQGLPPAIADSLPDKWGQSLFRAWIRDNHISSRSITPLDHLSFIGSRAMGALEYEPAQKLGDNSAFPVEIQRLYEFAKTVLNEQQAIVLNAENSILWQDLIKISSSPGGKRPKAIVAINRNTGEIISGQSTIPADFEHFILKYDDDSTYPYAKLEYLYYKMALNAGIHIMPSELRNYGQVSHFLTRRFDRMGNRKIHTQTLAAMSPESSSYEDVFSVIRRLQLPYDDSCQQFLRMVFNVVTRNVDDHSKNITFCMTEDGQWRLSPAYDLTFSVDLTAPAYVNRHSLSINGKSENITLADLEKIAQNNDIQDYKSLIEKVMDAADNFEKQAKELEIAPLLMEKIKREFQLSL